MEQIACRLKCYGYSLKFEDTSRVFISLVYLHENYNDMLTLSATVNQFLMTNHEKLKHRLQYGRGAGAA